MSEDSARTEFRAIRRQVDEGADVQRDWAFVPGGAVVGVQILDDEYEGHYPRR